MDQPYKLDIDIKQELLKSLAVAKNLVAGISEEALKSKKNLNASLREARQVIKGAYTATQSIANAYKSAIRASGQYYQNLQKIKSASKEIAEARIQSLLTSGVNIGAARTTGLFRQAGGTAGMAEIYPEVEAIQRRVRAGRLISATELYNLGKKTGIKFTNGMLDEINKAAKTRRVDLSRMVAIERLTGKKIYSTVEANTFEGFKKGIRRAEPYLVRRFKSIISFFGIYGVARITTSAIQARVEREQAQRTIATILPNLGITGSIRERLKFAKGEIERFMREMSGMGVDPFALQRPYMQFLAASKGSIEEARRQFSAFMTLAKVYGLNSEGIKGMTYALVQMKSKGRLSMEELSRQMGNQLPGAVRIFADAMGMSYETMLSTIKSAGIDSEFAIRKVTDYVQNKFQGLGKFLTQDFGSVLQTLRGNFRLLTAEMVSGTSGGIIRAFAFSMNRVLIIAREFAPLINAVSVGIIALSISANKAKILKVLFGASTIAQIRTMQGTMTAFGMSALMAYGSFEILFNKIRQLSRLRQVGGKGSGIQFLRDILPLVGAGALAIGTTVKGFYQTFTILNKIYKQTQSYLMLKKGLLSILRKELFLETLIAIVKNPAKLAIGLGVAAGVGAVGYGIWKAGEARIERTQENNRQTTSLTRDAYRIQPLDINMNLTGGVSGMGDYSTTMTVEENKDVGVFNFNNLTGNQI